MINSNKLSLFPDGKSNGLSDIPVEVSKGNCGCSSLNTLSSSSGKKLSPKPSAGLPRPIHQTARPYGFQCHNTDGSLHSYGYVNADDDTTAWALVGAFQFNLNITEDGAGVSCELTYN